LHFDAGVLQHAVCLMRYGWPWRNQESQDASGDCPENCYSSSPPIGTTALIALT
jgi:hypothetical protein